MKFKRSLIFIVLLATILFTTIGCQNTNNNPEPLSRTEFLMDTVINLKIYDKKDEKILDKAIDRLKEIEERMSVTIATSDVSLINEKAGIEPVKVQDDVYYVIQKAKEFAIMSNGAYEPTIGPLVELWDINDKFKNEEASIPSEKKIKEAKDLVDYNDLELLDDNHVYLKRVGMKIDLGGIAKGYAADEVKNIFVEEGVKSAIVDLGGNIYAIGSKSGGEEWKIGIQNPFEVTGKHLGIANVKDKSVVTSGDYERYFIYKEHRYHHIIDASTGYPSDNELSGISIISDKSIDCDALSTALFVLGVDKGAKLANELGDIGAIFVTKDEKVIIDKKTNEYFTMNNDKLELIER